MGKAIIINGQKQCTRCSLWKPLNDFYLLTGGYHDSRCKKCTSELRKEYYSQKKEAHTGPNHKTRVVMHNGRLMYISGRTWKLYWTGNMLSIMRKYHSNTSDREIAEMLGISRQAVSKKAKEMRLSKCEEYKKEIANKISLTNRINYNKRKKLKSL